MSRSVDPYVQNTGFNLEGLIKRAAKDQALKSFGFEAVDAPGGLNPQADTAKALKRGLS